MSIDAHALAKPPTGDWSFSSETGRHLCAGQPQGCSYALTSNLIRTAAASWCCELSSRVTSTSLTGSSLGKCTFMYLLARLELVQGLCLQYRFTSATLQTLVNPAHGRIMAVQWVSGQSCLWSAAEGNDEHCCSTAIAPVQGGRAASGLTQCTLLLLLSSCRPLLHSKGHNARAGTLVSDGSFETAVSDADTFCGSLRPCCTSFACSASSLSALKTHSKLGNHSLDRLPPPAKVW